MKTVAFLTLGCKLNYAETSAYERELAANPDITIVGWRQKADAYVVNTCSVTSTSDTKSRNVVRKVHRINPQAVIAVVGCSAQLRRSDFEKIEGVWRVFGAGEKSELGAALLLRLGIGCGDAAPLAASDTIFPAYSAGERTRSFLKIQDGCDNFCAYCTVPHARGRSRSVPAEKVLEMAREIASKGVKEIVLTGVNTGDYGRSSAAFLHLLKALNSVDGIERYRISSIEPNLITPEIIDWIASGTKFQPHFHIPLQSGSDLILQRMGRHYDTAFFRERIEYIRKAMEGPGKPPVFFGIDLMVGLPGETDEIFEQSVSFVESLHPAFIHVFPYSRRPGTPASDMPDQVPQAVKAARVERIEQLCSRLHDEFVCANKGICGKVLFESAIRSGRMEGYTGNYIRVERPYDPDMVNTLVDVVL